MSKKFGNKTMTAIEEEFVNEGISAYRKWRQSVKNGILPVGISSVGKTTFCSKFEDDGASLWLEFNRTVSTHIDMLRLQSTFIAQAKGVEYYKIIDVPGDLYEQWVKAFFDNNPRVLVIMVDHRQPGTHLDELQKFLALIKEGPTFWQRTKTFFASRRNNLSRIIFLINKLDQFDTSKISTIEQQYKTFLADVHQVFGVSINVFKVQLNSGEYSQLEDMFVTILEALAQK